MYKPVQAIEVRIWDRTVGAVALAPNLGYYAFEYDSRFVKSGIELAPLAMPLAGAESNRIREQHNLLQMLLNYPELWIQPARKTVSMGG